MEVLPRLWGLILIVFCFSVVTEFSTGKIHQWFIQDGKKIDMPESKIDGVTGNVLDDNFCKNQFKAFDDRDRFNEMGGWTAMNSALSGKWVLVMSLWDDVSCHSAFPLLVFDGQQPES